MILEIQRDQLRIGYWFRASSEHIYIVELESIYDKKDGELINVVATVYVPDCHYIDDDIDVSKIKKGERVEYWCLFEDSDWVMSIDIWSKYYFPKFNEEKNQWYHKIEDKEACYINDFSFILKEAYNKALEITNLKLY